MAGPQNIYKEIKKDKNVGHVDKIRFHEMKGRGKCDFVENVVSHKLTIRKIYEMDTFPGEINVTSEEDNYKKSCIIKGRRSNKDENKHNTKLHDKVIDSITVSDERKVKDKIEINKISKDIKEVKDPRLHIAERKKEPMEKQIHDEIMSAVDTSPIE